MKIIHLLCLFALIMPGSEAWASEIQQQSSKVEPQDIIAEIKTAWELGRQQGKQVMVVMGSDSCDRCALLKRYMQDKSLRARLDKRFVVLHLEVGVDIQVQAEPADENAGK